MFSDSEKARYSAMFRGENSANAKLTEDQARKIKYEETGPSTQIAKRYGISQSIAYAIRTGRAWRHV